MTQWCYDNQGAILVLIVVIGIACAVLGIDLGGPGISSDNCYGRC